MNEELKLALEEERKQVQNRDAKMLEKGFTHRVTYWDHHTGGDDKQYDTYFSSDPRTLTSEDKDAWKAWKTILRKCSYVGVQDYSVTELTAPCITCGANDWLENKTHETLFCRQCGSVKGGEQTKGWKR